MRCARIQVSDQSKTISLQTTSSPENAPLFNEIENNPKAGERREYTESNRSVGFYDSLRFVVLTGFLFGSVCVHAQTTPPSRQPTPTPSTDSSRSENAREVEGAFKDMSALEIPRTEESSKRREIIELTRNLYRKPSKSEMKVLEISADHLNKYAAFLRQSDTGIIKLNSDSSCTGNSDVITAKEGCLQYSMPGAGTSYSFRLESHRIPRLADLTLSKNVLKSDGIMQHGILVYLGDIPIEEVTLQTKGLKYLSDFKPLTDTESLAKFDRQLIQGINVDGFIYGLGVYVKNQATFALRSVAYKGKAMRSVNGIAYNEFDFDKRKDILVVFRIVEIEANGNITIVWKMLSNKDAPTLKIEKVKNNK